MLLAAFAPPAPPPLIHAANVEARTASAGAASSTFHVVEKRRSSFRVGDQRLFKTLCSPGKEFDQLHNSGDGNGDTGRRAEAHKAKRQQIVPLCHSQLGAIYFSGRRRRRRSARRQGEKVQPEGAAGVTGAGPRSAPRWRMKQGQTEDQSSEEGW